MRSATSSCDAKRSLTCISSGQRPFDDVAQPRRLFRTAGAGGADLRPLVRPARRETPAISVAAPAHGLATDASYAESSERPAPAADSLWHRAGCRAGARSATMVERVADA